MRLLLVLLAVIVLAEGHAAYWNNPLCEMCGDLIKYLEGKLEVGIHDVTQLATEFCGNKAPSFLVGACKGLVEGSMGEIIWLLENKVDSATICKKIKLCS